MQSDWIRNLTKREVRSVGSSLHAEVIQWAVETSRGGEYAFQTLDGAEISVFETVGALHRRATWGFAIPRAEYARGNDFSSGHGIGESSRELRGAVETQIVEFQMMQRKYQRWFISLRTQQHELGIVGHKLLEKHRVLILKVSNGPLQHRRTARLFGRKCNLQPYQFHAGNARFRT